MFPPTDHTSDKRLVLYVIFVEVSSPRTPSDSISRVYCEQISAEDGKLVTFLMLKTRSFRVGYVTLRKDGGSGFSNSAVLQCLRNVYDVSMLRLYLGAYSTNLFKVIPLPAQ